MATKLEYEMAEALRQLLKAFKQLMPGLPQIAVEDYANINEAPMAARDALRKFEAGERRFRNG